MEKILLKNTFTNNFEEQQSYSKGCWVKIVNPTEEELTDISKKFNIEKEVLDDVLDDESVALIEKEIGDGYILVILRVPFLSNAGFVVTMPLGILFLTKKDLIITISKVEDEASNKLFSKPPLKFRTDKKSIFFSTLLRKILNQYMRQLNTIEKEINGVEKSIKNSLTNKEIVDLLSFQKTLVYFKTSMVGNKKVVSKISLGRIFSIGEENKELLEDALIDIDEAQQLISIYGEIIKNTIDAYSSIVSNNLNLIMKFLALVTIALSIPTKIFSLYGMNVPLPTQTNDFTFILLIILSVAFSGLAILFFKLKKWM
ncbi:MAG: magnesium transporter CorA family protein [Candidatus ainarchaeum sp.]|nr:magnesium transporter CorA family protein [Candidatus ainarchaeum sp.]